MKRIHFDMSATLDQIDPAGATGSTLALAITRTAPSIRSWGEATFSRARVSRSVATVRVIASGLKILRRTNSSHGIPLAASTTSPATAYMMFW